jgi:hypothetical protein
LEQALVTVFVFNPDGIHAWLTRSIQKRKMNKYGFVTLNESNAKELAEIAEEIGALVLRGHRQHPGPETEDWERRAGEGTERTRCAGGMPAIVVG